jgi:hypothetical protein
MSGITDLLALLQLIRTHVAAAQRASELAERMQAEGRTELTSEELATLQATDDSARERLVDAIARAKADGR